MKNAQFGSYKFPSCHIVTSAGPARLRIRRQQAASTINGGIAQLVERQLCKLDVRGSNPRASMVGLFASNLKSQLLKFEIRVLTRSGL